MRILFSTTPALGHLLPLLPLARAARHHGHDVAMLTDQSLSLHLDAGFEVLPAGPTVDVLLKEARRRRGADPTDGAQSEVVADIFAGTRVDLTFDQALPAAKTPTLESGKIVPYPKAATLQKTGPYDEIFGLGASSLTSEVIPLGDSKLAPSRFRKGIRIMTVVPARYAPPAEKTGRIILAAAGAIAPAHADRRPTGHQ